MEKWTPTTDLLILRRMGKLLEELNELGVEASRCIIQGIDKINPSNCRPNRINLEDEIADVYAQLDETVLALELNDHTIQNRRANKRLKMRDWETIFKE